MADVDGLDGARYLLAHVSALPVHDFLHELVPVLALAKAIGSAERLDDLLLAVAHGARFDVPLPAAQLQEQAHLVLDLLAMEGSDGEVVLLVDVARLVGHGQVELQPVLAAGALLGEQRGLHAVDDELSKHGVAIEQKAIRHRLRLMAQHVVQPVLQREPYIGAFRLFHRSMFAVGFPMGENYIGFCRKPYQFWQEIVSIFALCRSSTAKIRTFLRNEKYSVN